MDTEAPILDWLESHDPEIAVELRPPRSGLDAAAGMDAWIDTQHAVRRFVARDRLVFFTDDAVGQSEEENLSHLGANLPSAGDAGRVVPFLTCKHPLEYCLVYAERARALGFGTLTVVGGDRDTGPARCVDHAFELRALLRKRVPGLVLGGWANPHRDPSAQADYLTTEEGAPDYFLTQIVSHHSAPVAEALLEAIERRRPGLQGAFGVFYYRSGNPRTLERLGRYFPVPAERLTAEFESGLSAPEICARSIRALRDAGARHVYVSNLPSDHAAQALRRVLSYC